MVIHPGNSGWQPGLLPGHTGFKGSWLSIFRRIRCKRDRICGCAPRPRRAWRGCERLIRPLPRSSATNPRDPAVLTNLCAKHNRRLSIHMAAQPTMRSLSYNTRSKPTHTCDGTSPLFEAVRQSPGVPAPPVNVTSDKCYETGNGLGYRRKRPLGGKKKKKKGLTPIAACKGCAERFDPRPIAVRLHPSR